MAIPFSPSGRRKSRHKKNHRSCLDLSSSLPTGDLSLSSHLMCLAIMEAWTMIKSHVNSNEEDNEDDEDEDEVIQTLDNISQILKNRRMSLPATLPTLPDLRTEPCRDCRDTHQVETEHHQAYQDQVDNQDHHDHHATRRSFRVDQHWITGTNSCNHVPKLLKVCKYTHQTISDNNHFRSWRDAIQTWR